MNPFELIPPDIQPLIASAATALGTTYLTKGDNGPIQTLSDLWYLSGAGLLHEKVLDKKQDRIIKRENEKSEKSAESVAKEVAKILEENIHEPRENIARPAISALNDYGSEEHTREMFAKLIAASMDATKDSIAHQSFVEIVKSMAPIDAKLLKLLSTAPTFPLAQIILRNPVSGFSTKFTHLFVEDDLGDDYSMIATSITNLERLGIVITDYQSHMVNESVYKKFENSSVYRDSVSEIENHKRFVSSPNLLQLPVNAQEQLRKLSKQRVDILQGIIRLSPMGKQFSIICLSD